MKKSTKRRSSPQVKLVKFAERHLELTWNWMQLKPVQEGFLLKPPASIKAHQQWFKRRIRSGDKDSEHYAITFEKRHVGNCGLKKIDLAQRTAELFIYLDPDCAGRGLASSAVRELQKIARRRGLRKIYLQVRIDNRAGTDLYLNNGFKLEGILRREFLWRGRALDMYRMAWFTR